MSRSRKSVSKPRIQTIPVLKLPSVPFTAILNSLKVLDVINLSQCSSRITNLISYSRPHKFASKVLSISITGNRAEVHIPGFTWYFCSQRDTFLADATFAARKVGENTSLNVFNSPIWPGMPDARWITPLRRESYENDVISLVKYLKMLFNCPIDCLWLCFKDELNFEKLVKNSQVFHKAQSICIEKCVFTPEEMSFMLDNFVTDTLKMEAYAGSNFVYSKTLSAPTIEIPYATWITDHQVLEMAATCKKLELQGAHRITDQCINQLIKNWLASARCDLEIIRIRRETQVFIANSEEGARKTVPMKKSDVLRGIEVLPGARKRRDAAEYYSINIHYAGGNDIRRQDGVLATININTDQFSFTVWYTPNPNV